MQKMMRENLKKSILIIVVLRPDYATLLTVICTVKYIILIVRISLIIFPSVIISVQ